ncbi:60S ribosomal protein L6 [Nymphon striatum]|nr:60S ribosomal protein L6 [Nymphon striatum]
MTDTKAKGLSKKMAAGKTTQPAAAAAKKTGGKKKFTSRNYVLPNGVLRFSRSRMFKKTASYKIKPTVAPKEKAKRPAKCIEKPIGGDKNGGKRQVLVRKTVSVKTIKNHSASTKHKLRKSITPGTILILVAGRHRGKRVVFLKQLKSGLLLVTGPLKLNGCPLRRIEPIFVMATKTKLNLGEVKVSPGLNDSFFKRKTLKKNKEEGDIFETKKKEYTVTQRRKKMQVDVDKQILEVIKKHPESKMMSSYLSSLFWLRNKMYPHEMIF